MKAKNTSEDSQSEFLKFVELTIVKDFWAKFG